MKIFEVLGIKKYLAIFIISTAFMFFFYSFVQVLGIIQNIDLFFINLPPLNFVLFLIFTILFGMNLSLFVYNRSRKVCEYNKKKVLGSSSLGTFFSFFVGVCPACTGFAVLLGIPLSLTTFLIQFNILFFSIIIGVLLLSIYLSDGFKKSINLSNVTFSKSEEVKING